MRRILVVAGLVLLVASNMATAQQADILRCNSGPLNAEQVSACTKLLPAALPPGDMATIRYRRALGYESLGQLDDVVTDTSQAIELLSRIDRKIARMELLKYRAYQLRAKAYAAKGQSDLADADIEQAVTLSVGPGAKPDAKYYNNRAWAYHLVGADAKALPIVTKALELEKTPNTLETRAEIYEKLGRREEAIADYRASLAGAPTMQPAKDGLARMGVTP
jgi:tetratricopeptide (TPR) repeat protein